jgi:hypothetical protein
MSLAAIQEWQAGRLFAGFSVRGGAIVLLVLAIVVFIAGAWSWAEDNC